VRHGVLFGRGISISGDGLSNLITIRPSHSEIGQQERKCNGGFDDRLPSPSSIS
jgi:hypothetical protein